MNQDPPKVVDLHPAEWKWGADKWRFFGAGAVPFLVYSVVGTVMVIALRFLAGLL
jgi:hypothetical protein